MDHRGNSWAEAIRKLAESVRSEARTICPGHIVSIGPGSTATVKLAVGELGPEGAVPPPILRDVPVLVPGNPRAGFCLRPLPGDPVIVLFADRDITAWKRAKGRTGGKPRSRRTHDVHDAIAISAVWPSGGQPAVDLGGAIRRIAQALSTSVCGSPGTPCPFAAQMATLLAELLAAGV